MGAKIAAYPEAPAGSEEPEKPATMNNNNNNNKMMMRASNNHHHHHGGRHTHRSLMSTSRTHRSHMTSRTEHGGRALTYRLHSARPGGELGIGDPHLSWSVIISELPAEHFDLWPSMTPFEQLGAVNDMRVEIKASGVVGAVEICHAPTLHRFLRARGFDVHKATQMLMQYIIWRRDHAVDGILDSFHYGEEHEVMKVFPQGYYKTDIFGRPVYYQFLAGVNMDDLRLVTTEERWLRFQVYEYENTILRRFPACSRAVGRYVDQTCVVLNVDGVSTRQFGGEIRQILTKIASVSQDNYPEMLGKMFIINAPFTFRVIWAAIRPMLNERTKEKIEVVGTKSVAQSPLSIIPAENLPEMFGGSDNCSAGKLPWEWLVDDVGPWSGGKTRRQLEEEEDEEDRGMYHDAESGGEEEGWSEEEKKKKKKREEEVSSSSSTAAAEPTSPATPTKTTVGYQLMSIPESSSSLAPTPGWTPHKRSLLDRIKELEARVEQLEGTQQHYAGLLPHIETNTGPTGAALLTPARGEKVHGSATTAVARFAACGGCSVQ